ARLFTPELSERAVVDVDTESGRRLASRSSVPTVTCGFRDREADVMATDVAMTADGVSFRLGGGTIHTRLRGPYNVSNCIVACVAARQLGIVEESIVQGVAALAGVFGRLEAVEAGQPFAVLVDYAHMPDSLVNVLGAARQLAAGGHVLVVFG